VNRQALEPVLGRLAEWKHHAFAALNTAVFSDGAYCHVARGARIEAPVRAVFLSAGAAGAAQHHGRVLLQLDAGASLQWVEVHAQAPGAAAPVFTTHVTEAAVGPAAALEGGAERDARIAVRGFTHAPGGAWVRNDVRVRFDAPGAEADLDGCWVADGEGLVDYHTAVTHAAEHTASRQLYKGVQGGASRGVFEGHVLIRPGAQQTTATQSNRNLLLSDDARVHTKPLLEIYADDVQCAHGAAIGQLDADALFYLRQRGIALDAARRMLAEAFVAEVTGRIADAALAEWVGARLLQALPVGAPDGAEATA
jgi:Fe-S cluster assembly protein SufD